ncbi:MAG: AAA family ATPase, partial [bacterium]|nr:AAA family ATPase [bacterium]
MESCINEEISLLLDAMPERIAKGVLKAGTEDELIEIVMDLGRPAEARFNSGTAVIDGGPVTAEEIMHVTEAAGDFGDDNRAGIEKTL